MLRRKLAAAGLAATGLAAAGLATRRKIDMAKRRFAGLGSAIAAAACLAVFPAAHAQDSDDVTVEIGNCRDLKTPDERRACYGARVDEAVQERERSAATAPADNRSSNPDEATTRPARARRDGSEDEPTVVARIATLRETVPNSYLITLDNRQVWRQIRPKWHPLRVGQEVEIYPTSWGTSFRLFVDGLSGYIQVEQVRDAR
jgi:hypothetical protein